MITEIIDQKIAEYFEAQSKPPNYLILDYRSYGILSKELFALAPNIIGNKPQKYAGLDIAILHIIESKPKQFIEVAF